MKVALVHDYLKEIGGAERVLVALHEMFPEAPVYTAYKFPKYWGHFRELWGLWDIRESWGRYLPFKTKLLSYYTIISPLFFANSKNVANRIRKFYRREAVVVYPPISVQKLASSVQNKNYYLIISRIVGTKNIELAVDAANKYKFKLKVAGKVIGSLPNFEGVEYLGEVSEEEKYRLMAGAKAFLALSKDEDFGITPVESMMCGTPVIAVGGGGYRETIINGETGVFFDELAPEGVIGAIRELGEIRWDRKKIIKHAGRVSKDRFKKEILEVVKKYA